MRIIDFILVAVAGVFYFRATLTTTRDYGIWSAVGVGTPVGPADKQFYDHIRRIGPLHATDPRVIVLTLLLTAPFVLASGFGNRWFYGPILCLGIGAFTSPLTAPTIEPESEDLSNFGRFIGKWLKGKLDIYLKLAFAGIVIFLAKKVPVIGVLPDEVSEFIFPIVSEDRIGHELIDTVSPILVAMLFLRFSMFGVYRYWSSTLALVGAGWIWFQFQYLFVEILENFDHSALHEFAHWKVLAFVSDFFLSLFVALAGFLSSRRFRSE